MREAIFFNCPHCCTELKLPPDVASPGDTVECPACNKDIRVRQPQRQEPPLKRKIIVRTRGTAASPTRAATDGQTSATAACWYCGKRTQTSSSVAIRVTNFESNYVGGEMYCEKSQKATILIPRCPACSKKQHRRSARAFFAGFLPLVLSGGLFGFLCAYLAPSSPLNIKPLTEEHVAIAETAKWVAGCITLVLFPVFALLTAPASSTRKRTKAFPALASKIKDGWGVEAWRDL